MSQDTAKVAKIEEGVAKLGLDGKGRTAEVDKAVKDGKAGGAAGGISDVVKTGQSGTSKSKLKTKADPNDKPHIKLLKPRTLRDPRGQTFFPRPGEFNSESDEEELVYDLEAYNKKRMEKYRHIRKERADKGEELSSEESEPGQSSEEERVRKGTWKKRVRAVRVKLS